MFAIPAAPWQKHASCTPFSNKFFLLVEFNNVSTDSCFHLSLFAAFPAIQRDVAAPKSP